MLKILLSIALSFVSLSSIATESDTSLCRVSEHHADYVGRDVTIKGYIVAGMHVTAVFDDACKEAPVPMDIDADSPSLAEFDAIMEHHANGNRSEIVEVYGNLRQRGKSFYIHVKGIELAK